MNVAQLEAAKKYILYLKRFVPKFKEKSSFWFRKVEGTTEASQDLANVIFEYSLNTTPGMKGALSAYGTHLYQANDVLLQGLDYLRAFSKRIASTLTLVNECESLVEKCLKYVRATPTPQLPTQQSGPTGSGSPIPTFLNVFSTLQTTLRSSFQVFLTAHSRVGMVAACRMVQGADDLGKAIRAIEDQDEAGEGYNAISLDAYGVNILGHTVDVRGVPSVEIKESQRVLRNPEVAAMSFAMGAGTTATPGGDFTFTNPGMSQTPNTPGSAKKRSRSAGKLLERFRAKKKKKNEVNPNTAISPGDGMSMGIPFNTPSGYMQPQATGPMGQGYMMGQTSTQFNMNTINSNVGGNTNYGNNNNKTMFNPNLNTDFGPRQGQQSGAGQNPDDDFGFED